MASGSLIDIFASTMDKTFSLADGYSWYFSAFCTSESWRSAGSMEIRIAAFMRGLRLSLKSLSSASTLISHLSMRPGTSFKCFTFPGLTTWRRSCMALRGVLGEYLLASLRHPSAPLKSQLCINWSGSSWTMVVMRLKSSPEIFSQVDSSH